ncbi:MAG: exopolysaccharide biosynthesis protein [Rhodospirillales bacterium]
MHERKETPHLSTTDHSTPDLESDLGDVATGLEKALEGPLTGPIVEARPRASDLLLQIANGPDERLGFGELLDGLGDRTFGLVLLVLAIINVMPQPPGGSTVFGLLLALIALQLLIGLAQPWVPAFVRRRSISRAMFRSGIEKVVPTLRRIERLCKPRVSWLTTGLFERLAGLAIFVFAVVIAAPIPVIGNVLPGIAVAIVAVGLIERDGLALLIGVGSGIGALALIAGLFTAAVAIY